MAAVPTITFGGTNINTFGCYLKPGTTGWLDAPDSRVDAADLVGAVGGVLSDTDSVQMRTLVLDLIVTATAFATHRTNEDTLKGYHRKDVTIRVADGANTREIDGRCTSVKLAPWRVPVSLRSDARVTFLCADPTWRATSSTNETINGTPNSIDLGNAPVSDWILTITATGGSSITDITVTFGPHTLEWTGTIASTKSLVISAADFTVENDGTNAISTYTGGFPPLDPRDSPSVSATKDSGAGTLDGDLDYKKRWW